MPGDIEAAFGFTGIRDDNGLDQYYVSYVAGGMHSVCETHAFRRAAEQAGMTEHEIARLVEDLARNPMAGDEMAGTGGCRKVRVGGRGKGKSGGYRTITFFTGETLPLFLLTVFSKGERANLSQAECNRLRDITKAIVSEYKVRMTTTGTNRA